MKELIQLEEVAKAYQGSKGWTQALMDINLSIAGGEVFGLIGESGAGKSTLLKLLNGVEQADQGSVTVDGVSLTHLSSGDLRSYKKKVGRIFQHFNLLNNLTVQENILLPLKLHAFPEALPLEEILNFVQLTDQADRYPSELSGGQKQRVGIARGLITNPKLLLCDEPTSALDVSTKEEIIDLLARINQTFEMTMVVVTHELDVVQALCDRVAVLSKGRLVDRFEVKPVQSAASRPRTYQEIAREVLADG